MQCKDQVKESLKSKALKEMFHLTFSVYYCKLLWGKAKIKAEDLKIKKPKPKTPEKNRNQQKGGLGRELVAARPEEKAFS